MDASPSVVLVGRPNVGQVDSFQPLDRKAAGHCHADPGDHPRCHRASGGVAGSQVHPGRYRRHVRRQRDPLHALVLERGRRAIADADLLVLVVDGREGMVPGDETLPSGARAGKPAVLAINKSDDRRSAVVRSTSIGSASSRCSRSRRNTARALAICSTRCRGVCRRLRRDAARSQRRTSRTRFGRRRRATQRCRTKCRSRSSAVRTPASRRW